MKILENVCKMRVAITSHERDADKDGKTYMKLKNSFPSPVLLGTTTTTTTTTTV